jgi:RimJ/RimL family protein N-acetyltransferase/predicted CoA-binding protein
MTIGPARYESDVVLRDGSTLRLRPVRPEDSIALRELHERLSKDSWRFRFFNARGADLPDAWRLPETGDGGALVLVAEARGRVSAVASCLRNEAAPDRAEVAFTVADTLQGRGVGTRLLEALARIARDHGIRTFDAYVLADNHQMARVFQDSGFEVEQRLEGGVVHVVLSLELTVAYETRAAERARSAAAASMQSFFEPRAVAVIGANRERGKIGSEILHNLTATGYTGRLFAVHPLASSIDGVRAFPSITSIPGDIDLAVICVPCARVSAVVDDCIAKGVKALVVISAGFSETGAAGRALEGEILDKVRTAGIRMIGPNCMGIINTDPAVRLNATFSPVAPVEGRVAFSTQSGALGLAILDYVRQLHIGISSFVSVGNKDQRHRIERQLLVGDVGDGHVLDQHL